jgi:MoxR-like ATPase
LDEEQMKYINEMEIPSGIGLNSLLKENIFAMIICILNKIPLFIVGKPGSSKSLAMNLVSKSFKGKCSNKKLFRKFPSIFSMMYQGSEQSTS